MENVIIIGGGIAGTTAAEELRKRNPTVQITIIQEEQHACYSRVLLPHYLKDKIVRDKVFLKQNHWYSDNNIELMSGVRALEINIENKFVRTSEERELPFDKLLIASGGELGLIDDDLRGVSYLRTLDDADHLKALIGEVMRRPEAERHALTYGSGFIACEYANAFKHWGIPFTMVMRGTGFWGRLLSFHSQKVLMEHAEKFGVEVIVDEPSPTLVGDDELMGVTLKNGKTYPAQILGVGIGLRFNDPVIKAAKIPADHGILANEYLETDLPDVYTAGDVAEFFDPIVNRQVRYGNHMNAQMQGRAVGATMSGERTAFRLVSSYATNLLGMHVVFIGDTNPEHAVVKQTVGTDEVSQEVFVRDGKLVGAVLIGDVKDRAKLTGLIGKPYPSS